MITTPPGLLAPALAITLFGSLADADAQDVQVTMTLERIGAVHMMRPEELSRSQTPAHAQLAATAEAPVPARATAH